MSELDDLRQQIANMQSEEAKRLAAYQAAIEPLKQQLKRLEAEVFKADTGLAIGDKLEITSEFQNIVAANNGEYIRRFYPLGGVVYLYDHSRDNTCFISNDPPGAPANGVIGAIPLQVVLGMRKLATQPDGDDL